MNEAPAMEHSSPQTDPEMSPETPAETSERPTYLRDLWSNMEHFTCLVCGQEGWSLDTFSQHMAVYHQGVMIEAPPGYEPPPAEETPTAEDLEEGEVSTPETVEDEGVHNG